MEMSLNTKLEVAVEVISAKIAYLANAGYDETNEEMQNLFKERIKMYMGDEEVINKIINVYGPEMKKLYEEVDG